VQRIVSRIRARWPTTHWVLRAGSSFARDELMAWCEQSGVDCVFGLARNARLEAMIEPDLLRVHAVSVEEREGAPVQASRELRYRTQNSSVTQAELSQHIARCHRQLTRATPSHRPCSV
jgi:hypothetical protein